jgi:phosphopantetheinyl transferase (holo-ACP synthase)
LDRLAQQHLGELVPLKLASSHPEGVVVYGAEFIGDQSLAARQALIKILQLQFAKDSSLGSSPACSSSSSLIDNLEFSTSERIDSFFNESADQAIKSQDSPQPSKPINLPDLDESTYPFKLSSGELVSFSHSGSRVLVAIAPSSYQTLGVDTERKPVTLKLAERFFTPSELQIIESAQHQLDTTQRQLLRQAAWMIKEAHGKAAGLSLFEAIAFDLSPVLNQALIALDQLQNSTHGDWTTEHGEFVFSGNLLDRWALCLS